MTTTTAKRQHDFNTRALNTLRQISWQTEDFTEADLQPFNTNPKFNIELAKYLGQPGFVLLNGHWDYLVYQAKQSLVPDAEGNCNYKATTIAADQYGSAVVYICMLLVFSYGEACAMRSIHALHPLQKPGSGLSAIAQDCAFKLVAHESRYPQGYQLIQDAAISKQLSAAALKVHIRKMVQCAVVNYIKETTTQPEIHGFLFDNPEEYETAGDDNFEVEDKLQLEYLREFMQRGIDDLATGDGVAKMVVDIYNSDEGRKLLRSAWRTDARVTFLTQLYRLMPLTELTKSQTKAVHDEILASFHQLLRLSQDRVIQKRLRIKNPSTRHYVKSDRSRDNGGRRYEGSCQMETAEFIETRIKSPYVTDEDYDLMVEAAQNDSFFFPTGSAFALN